MTVSLRRATPWLLVAILASNFILSVLGIDWGLPYIWHTDEKIDPAVHMIHQHTLDPDYFINPHLHIYAMALAVKAGVIGSAPIPRDTRLEGRATAARLGVELPDLDSMLERLWQDLQNASEVRV